MKRGKRIALEIFGPPPMGVLLAYVAFLISTPARGEMSGPGWMGLAQGAAVVILAAYLLAGIPSIIYAGIMEWRFARGLPPHSWRTVGFSSLLGLAAGVAMVIATFWRKPFSPGPIIAFGYLGLMTGLLLGLLIKILSRPKAAG